MEGIALVVPPSKDGKASSFEPKAPDGARVLEPVMKLAAEIAKVPGSFPDLPDVLGPELLGTLGRCQDFAEALARGDERALLQLVDLVGELRSAAAPMTFASPQDGAGRVRRDEELYALTRHLMRVWAENARLHAGSDPEDQAMLRQVQKELVASADRVRELERQLAEAKFATETAVSAAEKRLAETWKSEQMDLHRRLSAADRAKSEAEQAKSAALAAQLEAEKEAQTLRGANEGLVQANAELLASREKWKRECEAAQAQAGAAKGTLETSRRQQAVLVTELGSVFPDVPRVEGQSIPKAEAVVSVIRKAADRLRAAASTSVAPDPAVVQRADDAEAAAKVAQDELADFARRVTELERERVGLVEATEEAWERLAAQEDAQRAARASATEAESRLRDQKRRSAALEARIAQLEAQPRAMPGVSSEVLGLLRAVAATGDYARKALEQLEAVPETVAAPPSVPVISGPEAPSAPYSASPPPPPSEPVVESLPTPSVPPAQDPRQELPRVIAAAEAWKAFDAQARDLGSRVAAIFDRVEPPVRQAQNRLDHFRQQGLTDRMLEAEQRLEAAKQRLRGVEAIRDRLRGNLAEARRQSERLRVAQSRLEASKVVNGLEGMLELPPDLGPSISAIEAEERQGEASAEAVRPLSIVALPPKEGARPLPVPRWKLELAKMAQAYGSTVEAATIAILLAFTPVFSNGSRARSIRTLVKVALECGLGEVLGDPSRYETDASTGTGHWIGDRNQQEGMDKLLYRVTGAVYRTRIIPENPFAQVFASAFPEQLALFTFSGSW
jgi:vacuolar-type H+-ATPase subunit E/Vma4